ncbi:MAG: aldo/keto reductase, partial [Dolichospermum sp.]
MESRQTLNLPVMGCGTWAWGNRLLWGYDPSMDEQLQQVFNLCVSQG